jgi:hypothetical protein
MGELDEANNLRRNGDQPGLALVAERARYSPLYENDGHVIPAQFLANISASFSQTV